MSLYLKFENKITKYDSFKNMNNYIKTNNIDYLDCIVYPETKNKKIDKKNPIKLYPIPVIKPKQIERFKYLSKEDYYSTYLPLDSIDDNYEEIDSEEYLDYELDNSEEYEIDEYNLEINNEYY